MMTPELLRLWEQIRARDREGAHLWEQMCAHEDEASRLLAEIRDRLYRGKP